MPTLVYKGNYSKIIAPTPNPIPTDGDLFTLGTGILLDNNSHYLVLHAEVRFLNPNLTSETLSVNFRDPFIQQWWERAQDGFGVNRITDQDITPLSKIADGCLLKAANAYLVESLVPVRRNQTVTSIILQIVMFGQ